MRKNLLPLRLFSMIVSLLAPFFAIAAPQLSPNQISALQSISPAGPTHIHLADNADDAKQDEEDEKDDDIDDPDMPDEDEKEDEKDDEAD